MTEIWLRSEIRRPMIAFTGGCRIAFTGRVSDLRESAGRVDLRERRHPAGESRFELEDEAYLRVQLGGRAAR